MGNWECKSVSLKKSYFKIDNFQVWNTRVQNVYYSYLVVLGFFELRPVLMIS